MRLIKSCAFAKALASLGSLSIGKDEEIFEN